MGALEDNLKALAEIQQVARAHPEAIGPAYASLMAALRPVDDALASGFYRKLAEWIAAFEATLDADHEVGIESSFGTARIMRLRDIRYSNPALLAFRGLDLDGKHVEWLQHISQVSFQLLRLRRADRTVPKTKIGFSPRS